MNIDIYIYIRCYPCLRGWLRGWVGRGGVEGGLGGGWGRAAAEGHTWDGCDDTERLQDEYTATFNFTRGTV